MAGARAGARVDARAAHADTGSDEDTDTGADAGKVEVGRIGRGARRMQSMMAEESATMMDALREELRMRSLQVRNLVWNLMPQLLHWDELRVGSSSARSIEVGDRIADLPDGSILRFVKVQRSGERWSSNGKEKRFVGREINTMSREHLSASGAALVLNEIRILRKLNHPNIVSIHSVEKITEVNWWSILLLFDDFEGEHLSLRRVLRMGVSIATEAIDSCEISCTQSSIFTLKTSAISHFHWIQLL